MARDYAKYNSKRRVPNNKNRYPDIFIIITLLVVIGVTCSWIYTHKIKGAFTQSSQVSHAYANLKSFFSHKKSEQNASLPPHVQPVAQQEEVHFDFYNELPNMQMAVSSPASEVKSLEVKNLNVSAVEPAVSKKTTVSDKSKAKVKSGYRIELGHFKDMNLASEMRISLLLVGVDAEVTKIGNEFHLRQGPYSTLAQAKEVQKKLQLKGFESTIGKGV